MLIGLVGERVLLETELSNVVGVRSNPDGSDRRRLFGNEAASSPSGAPALKSWFPSCCKKEKRGGTASEAEGLLRPRKADAVHVCPMGTMLLMQAASLSLTVPTLYFYARLWKNGYVQRLLRGVVIISTSSCWVLNLTQSALLVCSLFLLYSAE